MITDFKLISKFKPFYKAGKSICLTADNHIIADDGENINYIDCKNLKQIRTLNKEDETVTCFVANPNDYTVILAYRNLHIRKIDRSNKFKTLKMFNSGHKSPIFAMSLNASSTRLTTGGADNKVRIWHLGDKEGNVYSCIYHKSKINILKNHPTRSMVVSVSMLDHDIAAWNTEDGQRLGIFSGHQNVISAVDFHSTTDVMVTASRDQTLIMWDCATFTKRCIIPVCESIETCIIWKDSSNGDVQVMIGGERGIMAIVDVSIKTVVQEYKKASLFSNDLNDQCKGSLRNIRTILPSPDGGVIVIRESDNIEFYEENMSLKHELAGQMSALKDVVLVGEHGDMILAIESAPYMRLFDCCAMLLNDDSECTQWPSHLIVGGHTSEIMSVSVFDEGRCVASGGKDGRVCVWRLDREDKRVKMKLITSLITEGSVVSTVRADKTGARIYVSYSLSESLAVLTFTDDCLRKVCEVYKPHSSIVSSMDVNIDNTLLATGSKDKLAKIWFYDKKKNNLINKGILKGHRRGIWSVKFSAIEKVLLTASMDKDIILWSLEDFGVIMVFSTDHVVYKALFSKDEKQIISCDENGVIKIWNREKRTVCFDLKDHDESVHAMNLVYNKEGQVAGLVAAGDSSMMCLYKENTKVQIEESKELKGLRIQQEQELSNLLVQEQYTSALKLAIKLNKPLSAYKILEHIHQFQTTTVVEMRPIDMADMAKTDMAKAFKTLDREELFTLFKFATKWYSNSKTFLMGNQVFVFVLCTVRNKELLENEDFVKSLKSSKYYASKHYIRGKELQSKVGLFTFLKEITVVKEVEDMQMDIQ